jgi:hypothetical protein
VSWWAKLIGRDKDQQARTESARAQREDAAAELAEVREIVEQRRKWIRRNHITEGFAAAFERRGRERHT